jgi:hypothetical protein
MQLTVKEDKLQAANKQKSDVAGIVAALQVSSLCGFVPVLPNAHQ